MSSDFGRPLGAAMLGGHHTRGAIDSAGFSLACRSSSLSAFNVALACYGECAAITRSRQNLP